MSFCSSCGANVNDADRFCSKCGKPIAITTPQPRIQMQPQTIRSNEVQYSIKEIRQKHRLEYKKMTRSAKASMSSSTYRRLFPMKGYQKRFRHYLKIIKEFGTYILKTL